MRVKRLSLAVLAAVPALTLLLALPDAARARKQKKPRNEDIINVRLGLEYSQWLVGPIYFLASEEERAAFLGLNTDELAQSFINEFWKRRDPEPEIFGNPALDLFEQRVELADRRFRENAVMGRRTDRGTLFVLYGEPALIQFDTSPNPREPDLEVWFYPKGAKGLSGLTPNRRYFFAEKDGGTVLYTPRASRRSTLRQ